jgi:putative membrane protein
LEVVPVFIAIPIMALTRTSFTLTPLLYRLIFIHGLILILGGHYTYAQVPVGFWLQELFDFSRNHYDRIGHLAQGFIPAILAREILLRKTKLVPGKMLFYIVASICLAFSAFYELIEWWAAIAIGASAEAFLGTQGDIWDSQWDMFMALIGSISAQYLLEKWHDQQLKRL